MTQKYMRFIEQFSKSGKKITDLCRIKKLLHAVGDPQEKLRFIHIAGTNGKGSMAQMFNEVLIDAGFKTGLFTSPYLIEYNDRIKVNGQNIPDDQLELIANEVAPIVSSLEDHADFSQFEITQTIAFLYFLKQGCDVVVLETGVGGLLDSTNIISTPLVSVIGSISYDHTAVLGDTLDKIAAQKAGIIKKNCPCVLSAGNDMRVVKVVREKAMDMTSQLVIPNLYLCKTHKWDIFGCEFSYKSREYSLSMGGLHQISNAITVIEALSLIKEKLKISYENVYNGLKKAKLYARVEVLSEKPLTILDGGHNPDGMKALAKALETVEARPKRAIIGMLREKNAADAVKELAGVIDEFICVDSFSPYELSRDELKDIILSSGANARASDMSVEDTIKQVREQTTEGVTVICGSLYLASEVKKYDI